MSPSRPRIQNIPRNLKPYYVALFRAGEQWNDTEDAEDLVAQQLAFLRVQFEAGIYRAAGPITDGGAFSAMAIIEAESLEFAQKIVEQDPGVATKRLAAEVHTVLLPSLDSLSVEY